MTPQALRTATLAVLALGAAATFGLLVSANGSVSGLLSDGAGVGFVLWALGPYVLLAAALARFASRRARLVGLVGSLLVVVPAVAIYADALFVHPDAQNGLVFVTLPVLQIAAALATIGSAWFVDARARREGRGVAE